MKVQRINGGYRFGRTWIGFRRVPGYVPRRFRRRAGGQATPGPWVDYQIPFVGTVTISRDRTLFGYDDPASGGGLS